MTTNPTKKVFAEICVLEPADTRTVVETLIDHGFAAVIRGNAYDEANPTIFVCGYGKSYIPNLPDDNEFDANESAEARAAGIELREWFIQLLEPVGGDVTESGAGHLDTTDEVMPPVGSQFAIDVLDDRNGISRRIGCAEYTPDRFVKMLIEAAGLLANARNGNALARRLLLAALGPIDDADDEDCPPRNALNA